MRKRLCFLAIVGFLALTVGSPLAARADYEQRFSFGAGFWHMNSPSQTDFELGAEYEHRVSAELGIGAGGNYIFSNPAIGLVAAPTVFLHPLAGEWFVSASPLFEFGSGISTRTGVRLGTRVPMPLGAVTLIPSFSADLIDGGPNYIFGIGFEI